MHRNHRELCHDLGELRAEGPLSTVPSMAGVARSRLWIVAFTVSATVLAYPWLHDVVLGVEVTPAQRGYGMALRSGCFTCHGPNGAGGVKNPGSEDGEVPGFSGG